MANSTSENNLDRLAAAKTQRNTWTPASLSGIAMVALCFVVMAVISWRKWPDLITDYGVQLYIPWRLSEGAVLYKDLYYLAGSPFSQYFDALLFKIFGASFTTLFTANLVITALLVLYIYRRFLAVSNALTATTVGVGIVTVFAFSQYVTVGNYNFISPYSNEMLHGLALSVLIVGLLADWLVNPRWWQMALAGFFAGIVFLTKPDIFLAACACIGAAYVLRYLRERQLGFAPKSLGIVAGAAVVPPLLSFLFFLRVENWRDSLRATVFGWTPVFRPEITNNVFYVWFRGMDTPWEHIRQMLIHFAGATLVIGLYAVLFRRLNRQKDWPSSRLWIIWLLVTLPLALWAAQYKWNESGISLPLWGVTILGCLAWQLVKQPGRQEFYFPTLWAVFALIFMSKLGIFARLWHCGFILAMPVGAITLYFLVWLLPRLLDSRFQVPAVYLRATLLVAILIAFGWLANFSRQWYAVKRDFIGSGANRMAAGPFYDQSAMEIAALDWINKNIPINGTLAVLPSGITFNVLSHRINPTPCLFWDPVIVKLYGEANMTAQFEAAPPDYVMLIEVNESDFGLRYLGDPGFGEDLMKWVHQNYQRACLIGNEPLTDNRFGIEILQRIAPKP